MGAIDRSPHTFAQVIALAAALFLLGFNAERAHGALSETVTPVSYPYLEVDQMTGESTVGPESVSADNRYVAFVSDAWNLVADDEENDISYDVFVKDLADGSIELVSRPDGSTSTLQNGDAWDASISANGRYVAFSADSTNLVAAMTPADTSDMDVFVRDLQTNQTRMVSLADGGSTLTANALAKFPSISADGSRVAFYSNAANLNATDDDSAPRVFVRDIEDEDTLVASLTDSDQNPPGGTGAAETPPAINADGTKVAFVHDGVLAGDPPSSSDAFVRNLSPAANTTTWASAPDGAVDYPVTFDEVRDVAINGDGNVVAFTSETEALDPNFPVLPADFDVFKRNIAGDTTQLVSRGLPFEGGGALPRESYGPGISDDGTLVGFTNMYESGEDVLFRALHRATGESTAVTMPLTLPDGWGPENNSSGAGVSPDGSAIAFIGGITRAKPNDGGATHVNDVFIRGAGDGAPPPIFSTPLPKPPTATVQPPSAPPPPPTTGQAKLAKTSFRAGIGTKLTIRVSEPGTLTATYLKGKKNAGRFTQQLKAGKQQIKVTGKIKSKKLKPGKYKLALAFKSSATGLTAKTINLALTIQR
jgi:Tol biopolymer transport system component